MADVNRPWQAMLVALAEQVVRGVKPLAHLSIKDSKINVTTFIESWIFEQPPFLKSLEYTIEQSGEYVNVYLYTDTMVMTVVKNANGIGSQFLKDVLMGFLYGYDAESIWEYVRNRVPSKY